MESQERQDRERDELQDEPLREEDVTAADRLDDRVQEAEGLPDEQERPAD